MQENSDTTPSRLLSPFDPLLKNVESKLPAAFQHQFLHPVGAGTYVVLEGDMDEVWHRPAWLWPLFWLSAQFDILFPETGTDIPASMHVIGGRDHYGEPVHQWNRSFEFKRQRHFNATMAYDHKQRSVVEWLGPASMIQIVWNIRFRPPTSIEIITKGCNLVLGKMRVPLPKWLYPQVKALETAIAEDTIHINLEVSHPLLGAIFGYTGDFHVRIVPDGK